MAEKKMLKDMTPEEREAYIHDVISRAWTKCREEKYEELTKKKA